MRRRIASIVVVSAVVIQGPGPIHACGEKLMMLGRGVRFQSRHTPRAATVLLYLPQTGAARPLSDPNLESALREAGHTVRAVTTPADLENALRDSSYDVVLANISDAPDLDRARTVTDRKAVVLPAVYLLAPQSQQTKEQTRADRAKAAQDFSVVIDVPGRPGHYCAAVDKAMELKLKREQASTRRP